MSIEMDIFEDIDLFGSCFGGDKLRLIVVSEFWF